MTYQTNDIAELENRQANYSLAFSLPKTANNCGILGFADIPDVVTDFPYRKHDCRLYSNNYAIAGEGAYIILDKVTDLYFECQILSGNASFFDILKEKPMEELDLGYIIMGENTFLSGYKDAVYCIPAASFVRNGERILNSSRQCAIPAVFVANTMEQICKQAGDYILNHNLQGKWEDLAVNLCDLKTSTNAVVQRNLTKFNGFLESDIKTDPSKSISIPSDTYLKYNSRFDGDLTLNLSGKAILNSTEYAANGMFLGNYENGYFELNVWVERQVNGNYDETILNYKKLISQKDIMEEFNFSEEIKVSVGHIISIGSALTFYAVGTALRADFDLEFNYKYENTPNVESLIGNNLSFSKNLGFETQFDYFKSICQTLGLRVNVIEEKK